MENESERAVNCLYSFWMGTAAYLAYNIVLVGGQFYPVCFIFCAFVLIFRLINQFCSGWLLVMVAVLFANMESFVPAILEIS